MCENPTQQRQSPALDATESARPSFHRRLFLILSAMVAGLVLAAMILEVGLWIFAPVGFREWIIWEAEGHIRARPMPNQEIHTQYGGVLRINKDGFRGPDYNFKKAPGTLRIVAFGGSSTFCYNASSREAIWTSVLERRLHDALDIPVEVINLGLPGFDVFHSKINYLCFGRAFSPDAIIVYHTWNDLKAFRELAKTPYRPVSSVPDKPLWQRLARMTQIGRRTRNMLLVLTHRRQENTFLVEGPPPKYSEPIDSNAFAWERQNFSDFVLLAAEDNVLPILVSQATACVPSVFNDADVRLDIAGVPEYVGMTHTLTYETWLRVNEIIADVARKSGAIYVDGFNAVPHDFDHLVDHVHLTDRGCSVLGNAMANTILQAASFRSLVDRVRNETPSSH